MRHEILGCEVLQEPTIEHRLRIGDAGVILWECRVKPDGAWWLVAGMQTDGRGTCGQNLQYITDHTVDGQLFVSAAHHQQYTENYGPGRDET